MAVTTLAALPVAAQSTSATDVERARAGLDPLGTRVGSLLLYPEVGLEALYNDNIFADDTDEQGDTALVLTPQLVLSNPAASRHNVEVGASAALARYADFDSEDYDDYRLWLLGEGQVGDGVIAGEIRHSHVHEDRTSPDDLGVGDLTTFDRDVLSLSYKYQPARTFIRVDGLLTLLDFDATDMATGPPIDNDDRDRTTTDLGLRLGRVASPSFSYFIETRYDDRDYDQQFDRDGFERSSEGIEFRVGGILDLTNVITGEFFAGYTHREYEDPRFEDSDGPTLSGNVDWAITQLTTLTFRASRLIGDTTVVGASGITKTLLGVQVNHELLRSLHVGAELEFLKDNFDGIDRKDDVTSFEVGARYLMNRYLQLAFGYQFQERDTSPDGSGGQIYEINEIFVRIVGQL